MLLQPGGYAHTLELAVVRPLDDPVISQCIKDLLRQLITFREVTDDDLTAIHAVSEQQYLEVIRLSVLIDSGFCQVGAAECFNIDLYTFHVKSPPEIRAAGSTRRPRHYSVIFSNFFFSSS